MQSSARAAPISLGLTLAILSAALLPAVALAEAGSESTWGLGVAGVSTQKAYGGSDRDNTAFPLIVYENPWLRVFGPVVEAKLPSLDLGAKQRLDFRLLAKYDGSGYASEDAPLLAGMQQRKPGFWAGGKVSWKNEIADLSLELTGDASGHSKGTRASLGLERNWRLGEQVMLAPRMSASWMDAKYVDYYYGVRADEATAGRAAYSGKATVNAELGARATYQFDRQNALFLDAGITGLGKGIKNSPLVDRPTENRVAVGYLYRF